MNEPEEAQKVVQDLHEWLEEQDTQVFRRQGCGDTCDNCGNAERVACGSVVVSARDIWDDPTQPDAIPAPEIDDDPYHVLWQDIGGEG